MNPFRKILELGLKNRVTDEIAMRNERIARQTVQSIAKQKINDAALGLRLPMTEDELIDTRRRAAGQSVTAKGLEKERAELRHLPRPGFLNSILSVFSGHK
jgi:hypothetical protein